MGGANGRTMKTSPGRQPKNDATIRIWPVMRLRHANAMLGRMTVGPLEAATPAGLAKIRPPRTKAITCTRLTVALH
jgi:hypothetical protein